MHIMHTGNLNRRLNLPNLPQIMTSPSYFSLWEFERIPLGHNKVMDTPPPMSSHVSLNLWFNWIIYPYEECAWHDVRSISSITISKFLRTNRWYTYQPMRKEMIMFWNGLINCLLGFILAIFAVITVVIQAPMPPLVMLLMPVLALGLCISGMVMMTFTRP